ncbi:MAG: outer membrane protein assembly factor BamC [Gammaproteobacteria bacterium]|nr:outer membrane protein assembly factor BamC [Gammaproteobacteria bacterium]NNJ72297.1 outer membrane protein assembly factor BamC [Enterobacterales bacterium]
MYKQSKIFLVILSTTFAGCSWLGSDDTEFSDYAQDYTRARMANNIEIPPQVGTDNSQDLFVVPEIMPGVVGEVFGQENEVMAPMQILTLGNDVRANKEVQNASAFINETEIAVWDIVNKFIEADSLKLASKDIAEGSLETDWVTRYEEAFWGADKPVSRHKYRVNVLDSERPNETRLDIEVVAAQNYIQDSGWESYVDTNRAGAEFMNQILGFMYVQNIKDSRQRVTQSALGGITVNLGIDADGTPALVTSSDFQQTWDRVPVAMNLVQMQVDDKDRSQGLYFISRNENNEGFFESLAFWSDDAEGSLDVPKGDYRVQILNEGPKTYIIFTDPDDVPLKADVLAKNFAVLAKAFKARVSQKDAS